MPFSLKKFQSSVFPAPRHNDRPARGTPRVRASRFVALFVDPSRRLSLKPRSRNQRRPPDSPRWARRNLEGRRKARVQVQGGQRRRRRRASPSVRSPSPSRTSASTRKSSRWSRKVRRARSRRVLPARIPLAVTTTRTDTLLRVADATARANPRRLAPRLTAPGPRSIRTRSLQAQAGEARREGSGQGAPQGHQFGCVPGSAHHRGCST